MMFSCSDGCAIENQTRKCYKIAIRKPSQQQNPGGVTGYGFRNCKPWDQYKRKLKPSSSDSSSAASSCRSHRSERATEQPPPTSKKQRRNKRLEANSLPELQTPNI
jgi:hypothetical protein